MSTASISYKSLTEASGEAKSVARKLDNYADSLHRNVYKKLSGYNGSYTSNISAAINKTNAKITELRTEQTKYETYAADLKELREECKEVDKAVKSRVSSLTASFKQAHGIRNSKVENAIHNLFTGMGNSTASGRWLGDRKDDFKAGMSYFKDSIKEWYHYDGGKELIKGVFVGLLEVVIGVLAIVGAVLSGGALLVVIAGVVGGVIAVANGIANIWNERKAYDAVQDNDPATGKRRSEINSCQDYLRSSFIFGDDGEKYEYNKFYNGFATGIDIVNLACTVVTTVSAAGKLIKNGYKWATGNAAKVKDITLKQVFSKDSFKAFGSKLKLQFADGLADIKKAFKYHDWSLVKDFGSRILADIGENLKAEFWNFSSSKDAVGSIKNMISLSKDIVDGGFSASNIVDVGISSVVLPAITAFYVNGDGSIEIGKGGQLQWNLTDNITLSDIAGVFEKCGKIGSSVTNLVSNDAIINVDIADKLSGFSHISISIPEVNIPNIDMPVMRAA